MKTKKTVNQKLKRIFLSLLLPAAMTASVTCYAQGDSGIPPHQMRVASYNIQHGMGMDNQLNYKRIAEVLRAISPDVVAVQEVDSMTQRTNNTYALGEIAEQLNYYASYAPAIDFEGGKYGIGILSRERPISVRQYALPGSEEARTLLVAEFDDYVFASTHLSLTEADRMASIGIIEEAAKKSGKPFVVAGDLNAQPDSPFIRQFEETFQICSGKQKSWPADKPTECLDYIAAYKRKSVGKSGKGGAQQPAVTLFSDVLNTQASDHRPIVAELVLPR